jgi:peptidoglycan hydrolase-like protein with peptidoglycan-binding domain
MKVGDKMLLRLGMRNARVREMQQKLNSLGYQISVDGIFGFGTLKVVKKFQSDNALIVDGVYNENYETEEKNKYIDRLKIVLEYCCNKLKE